MTQNRDSCEDVCGDVSNVWVTLEFDVRNLLRKNGAGDEDRTRNFQLGNQNFRSFIFATYKTAQEKSTCMHRVPCMQCLIFVSLGDVWGTVSEILDT